MAVTSFRAPIVRVLCTGTSDFITLPAYVNGNGYRADNGSTSYFIDDGALYVTVDGVVRLEEPVWSYGG